MVILQAVAVLFPVICLVLFVRSNRRAGDLIRAYQGLEPVGLSVRVGDVVLVALSIFCMFVGMGNS